MPHKNVFFKPPYLKTEDKRENWELAEGEGDRRLFRIFTKETSELHTALLDNTSVASGKIKIS